MSRSSLTDIRSFLIWLCLMIILIQVRIIQIISMIIDEHFQVCQCLNEDHQLTRRNPGKVIKMLQQILQRGEMQVHPYRIQQYIHRFHSRLAHK